MSRRYTRLLGTRQEQFASLRKQGWTILNIKNVPVVLAFQNTSGKVWVKAWQGNANAADWFYSFASMTAAETYAKNYVQKMASVYEYKAKQKAEVKEKRAALKASDHWTVGDVYYNSWGYDQTNVDWYQVVEVKAKSLVVRPIKKNYGESGFLSGYCQPRRNDFCGEPTTKPLSEDGRISMRHGGASKWDGRAVYESHYA